MLKCKPFGVAVVMPTLLAVGVAAGTADAAIPAVRVVTSVHPIAAPPPPKPPVADQQRSPANVAPFANDVASDLQNALTGAGVGAAIGCGVGLFGLAFLIVGAIITVPVGCLFGAILGAEWGANQNAYQACRRQFPTLDCRPDYLRDQRD